MVLCCLEVQCLPQFLSSAAAATTIVSLGQARTSDFAPPIRHILTIIVGIILAVAIVCVLFNNNSGS
jgi:hypothetical protein